MNGENRTNIVLLCSSTTDFEDLEKFLAEGYKIKHADNLESNGESGIVYVLEKEPSEKIVSVKSVDLNDVDSWLSQGYVVRDLYAKNATIVKVTPE
jgi:hypothetical protein